MTVYVNEAKKESILLHRLNSRMITIDHMYTPLLSEETIYSTHHHALARRKLKPGLDVIVNHAFALPRIRTIQRRQQSGAQSLVHSLPYPLLSGPRNYSHNCPGEERNTKQKKQKVPRLYNKLLPALAGSGEAKPYSTGGSGPSRDLACRSLARKMLQSKPTALWELHCIGHSSMLFFVFRCWMA
jgi:hypothetical protein